jgi:hypothetical protein
LAALFINLPAYTIISLEKAAETGHGREVVVLLNEQHHTDGLPVPIYVSPMFYVVMLGMFAAATAVFTILLRNGLRRTRHQAVFSMIALVRVVLWFALASGGVLW